MLDNYLINIEDKIKKSIDVLKFEFSKIVINRVNVSLIRSLYFLYNNEKFFFDQVSVITVESVNTVFIKPFDKQYISLMCSEIIKLNLDLNPSVLSDSIKIVFPLLTMERRQFFLKKVKNLSEDVKISIRNIRKNFLQDVKLFLKSNKISKDDEKIFLTKLQKLIDSYMALVDSLSKKKEKDLLNV